MEMLSKPSFNAELLLSIQRAVEAQSVGRAGLLEDLQVESTWRRWR